MEGGVREGGREGERERERGGGGLCLTLQNLIVPYIYVKLSPLLFEQYKHQYECCMLRITKTNKNTATSDNILKKSTYTQRNTNNSSKTQKKTNKQANQKTQTQQQQTKTKKQKTK